MSWDKWIIKNMGEEMIFSFRFTIKLHESSISVCIEKILDKMCMKINYLQSMKPKKYIKENSMHRRFR